MAAPKVGINEEDNTITMDGLTFNLHPLTFEHLKKQKAGDRKQTIEQAINVGLLAAAQGRLSATISAISENLQGEYSLLSQQVEVLQGKLAKDNKYKGDRELDVQTALREFAAEMGYSDLIEATGTVGDTKGNKTGDVLATIHVNERKLERIAIEVKFASTYSEGVSRNSTKGRLKPKGDTAISQLLEAQAVQDGAMGIFVVDVVLNPIDGPSIQYRPEVNGFIVKVNVLERDFSNLGVCYSIARSMVIAKRDGHQVDMTAVDFLIREVVSLLDRQKFIKDIGATILTDLKTAHDDAVTKVKDRLITFDSELAGLQDAMKWAMTCFQGLMKTGTLSADEMFELYMQKNAQIDYDAKQKELTGFYNQ